MLATRSLKTLKFWRDLVADWRAEAVDWEPFADGEAGWPR